MGLPLTISAAPCPALQLGTQSYVFFYISPGNMENAFHAYNHSMLMLSCCAAVLYNSMRMSHPKPEVHCLLIAVF